MSTRLRGSEHRQCLLEHTFAAEFSRASHGRLTMARTSSSLRTSALMKGDASYYSIPADGDRSRNAVWTYETPFEAMAQIKDYIAFYPDRVDEID